MGTPRFFVEGVYDAGQTVTLAGDDAHKIAHVLRKRSGDAVQIIDSGANRFDAVLEVENGTVRALLSAPVASQATPRLHITVAQGVPKGRKMDFVVEKLTELGVAAIVPFYSERSVVIESGRGKVDRWRRLAKSAAAQCGRDEIPEVREPVSFAALLNMFSQYDCVLFPWELAGGAPLRDVLPAMIANARRVLIVVGPEGGFAHSEAEAAERSGAHVIGLGAHILRTETAALVVVALLNYLTVV
ncbi:MAG TPA: RsmE family RNA methyltransferase [Candidatus Rubrimentiphilum sp.]|nr:RsmE family RNA methyltransferase [Candidatus Rubrimentiphilum sp.]